MPSLSAQIFYYVHYMEQSFLYRGVNSTLDSVSKYATIHVSIQLMCINWNANNYETHVVAIVTSALTGRVERLLLSRLISSSWVQSHRLSVSSVSLLYLTESKRLRERERVGMHLWLATDRDTKIILLPYVMGIYITKLRIKNFSGIQISCIFSC